MRITAEITEQDSIILTRLRQHPSGIGFLSVTKVVQELLRDWGRKNMGQPERVQHDLGPDEL